MKNMNKLRIGKIVATDYRTAVVFKAHDIDFSYKGGRTLEEVCDEKGIDSKQLIIQLMGVLNTECPDTFVYDFWPMDMLADYIEEKHHVYIRNRAPVIQRFLSRLCKSHGRSCPELLEIEALFELAVKELFDHLNREELVLFPYIRKMVRNNKGISLFEAAHFDAVREPVLQMMKAHEIEGARFKQISELANHYKLSADACNTYKVTYAFLREFDADLQKHIHLENNILFVKALGSDEDWRFYRQMIPS